jgi:hypothetical protein
MAGKTTHCSYIASLNRGTSHGKCPLLPRLSQLEDFGQRHFPEDQ